MEGRRGGWQWLCSCSNFPASSSWTNPPLVSSPSPFSFLSSFSPTHYYLTYTHSFALSCIYILIHSCFLHSFPHSCIYILIHSCFLHTHSPTHASTYSFTHASCTLIPPLMHLHSLMLPAPTHSPTHASTFTHASCTHSFPHSCIYIHSCFLHPLIPPLMHLHSLMLPAPTHSPTHASTFTHASCTHSFPHSCIYIHSCFLHPLMHLYDYSFTHAYFFPPGLDAASSRELLAHLNDLAASNRTVVLTIHQPRLEIFHMFHRLVLLSDGKVCKLLASFITGWPVL